MILRAIEAWVSQMGGRLRKWMTPKHIAALLFVLGASICYEEDTEYNRIMTWEADVAGRHHDEVLQRKRAIVPVFLAVGDLVEQERQPSSHYRVRIVERFYLFGLISTKSKFKYNIAINIKPPVF